MSDLLPCPFCGSSNICIKHYVVHPDNFHDAYVECDSCDVIGRHAMTLEGWLSSEDEAREYAVTAWNTRAPHQTVNTDNDYDFLGFAHELWVYINARQLPDWGIQESCELIAERLREEFGR